MVYRPTVRYHSTFKTYVDDLFHATHLDRNQIIRAALFAAAHSKEFQTIIHSNKKKDVPLPCPKWLLDQPELWRESNPEIKERREDVYAHSGGKTSAKEPVRTVGSGRTENNKTRCQQPIQRSGREVPTRIKNAGGGFTIQLRP